LFLLFHFSKKNLAIFTGQLPHILPDYMLVFAVPILAHDPEFTSHMMVSQLKIIQQCLWFILEPLITKNEYYCYGFYKNLVERMKSHKDALKPEDNEMNYVIIVKWIGFLWSNCLFSCILICIFLTFNIDRNYGPFAIWR